MFDRQTDRNPFDLRRVRENGIIPTFHLENDEDYLTDNKKNRRVKELLKDLEINHNYSWYKELKLRSINRLESTALFYRANKISFGEMFENADQIANGLYNLGIRQGDEIAVCMSNIPELAYIMLAINKIGARMNSFSEEYNSEYIGEILANCNKSIIFITDTGFLKINELVAGRGFDNIVVISKSRSLPADASKCDEYVSQLDAYYHMEDVTDKCVEKNNNCISFDDFIKKYYSDINIPDNNSLDTEFLVTYTSGSTKIGFPKAIIHTNRSLIVSGRFHDSEVSGNPDLGGLRALAMIHPDSNTCLITCISDILMQGWCVAFEPEYSPEKALDCLMINKPNYANMTATFWNYAATSYLIERRFGNTYLRFLLAAFVVGEGIGKGEEYYLNRFLRKARAGSGISIKGFHFPYVTISVGGGDCEHGGIYYTLWKSLYSKLNFIRLRGRSIGMLPEKYVVVNSLKENDGKMVKCAPYELGIIVANSATTMKGYRNNKEETIKKIITDNDGKDWVSCNVIGYLDELGAVHVKGRAEEYVEIDNNRVYPYQIDYLVDDDKRNVLSSATVITKDKTILVNIIISPFACDDEKSITNKVFARLRKKIAPEVVKKIKLRVFYNIKDFPITGSGKRNIRALEEYEV